MAVANHPTHDSLLARHAYGIAGLALSKSASTDTHAAARYPLPETLIRGVTAQQAQRPLFRGLAHAFLALVALFCAASAASAWQNRNLVERVSNDMARYRAIPVNKDSARVDALNAVKR